MDPTRPESFNHRFEKLSTGRTYHFVDQLPSNHDTSLNQAIVCIHGFPDCWYGWRYQIGPWVRQGYRVIVPDTLGYGDTDKPSSAEEYSMKSLCADIAALLDKAGLEKAIIVGHDWGSHMVGRFALYYPNRVLALAMLSVPYIPPSPVYLPLEEVARKSPNLGYQLFFGSQQSTKIIEVNLRGFMDVIFQQTDSKGVAADFTRKGAMDALLNNSHVRSSGSYYHQVLSKGMNEPLNYYRTSKFRHDEEKADGLPSNLRADLPVLFLWGTKDRTATPALIRKSSKFITRLQDIAIENKGHWIMAEAKYEVTAHIAEWLKGLGYQNIRGKL
ncbi:hypothetical protein AGABI2DRAFT_78715 [Agaricus bisporus var. bisporus H97]|uniref:hypothetical protein n=1 Tax=Agaricus bisporus var. bisporus (strain H97 / ATCC MYA-4626 / FGSC 10389) TaxID=936046 RepID=UPI00029F68F6|nr:hypothetical protein AGABI2DRAFT_78715 [Agaricus bisporus var. bisporus H97]EKV42432.1 hypothetical protein AGABI2DRAFT_78715 [Agaricus bisporus var. bisporus H97]